MSEPILSISKLNKSFGPVHVLHDVDFHVYPGEVTALVGDNGAGKSTVVKCIAGIYGLDSGEITFEGQPVTISDPRAATALGIEFVYQDLALADNLDITQNMFLGREVRRVGSFLNDGEMERQARETLASLMTTEVVSCRPEDDLYAVWKLMAERRLQSLPVLGVESRPIGVLDLRDALKALFEQEQYQERLLEHYVTGFGYT